MLALLWAFEPFVGVSVFADGAERIVTSIVWRFWVLRVQGDEERWLMRAIVAAGGCCVRLRAQRIVEGVAVLNETR